jgi:hypothetical protein
MAMPKSSMPTWSFPRIPRFTPASTHEMGRKNQ